MLCTVQLRMLLLVGSLLLVVMFVARARDPKFWSLLGFEDRPIAGGPPLTDAEIARQSVDTQLLETPAWRGRDRGFRAPPRATPPAEKRRPTRRSPRGGGEWRTRTLPRICRRVARRLASIVLHPGRRRTAALLRRDRCAPRRPTPPRERPGRRGRNCSTNWASSGKSTPSRLESLSTLPEAEQTLWCKRLSTLNGRWPEFWNPLLSEWAGEGPAPSGDPVLLERFQQHLDDVVVDTIRDNTMARPPEKAVWFRWLARLRDTPPDDLRAQSLGPTGYLPLFKQPRDYRGKVVTVRGVVHLAYHVALRRPTPHGHPGLLPVLAPTGGRSEFAHRHLQPGNAARLPVH